MSDWQKTLHQSVDSLDKLKAYVTDRFGAEVAEREIDVAALQPAFDNFQMRLTPAALDLIQEAGDPMMLSDRRLEFIFQRLREIKHVEIIRIGSRITSHLPERITQEFCDMVKKYHPVYMNTHFDHPSELTPAAVAALGRLADAGVPLGCQTVLLRGVNDDPGVMKELMPRLLAARVRPYYIYMCDQVAGAEHFRTTVETGLEIIRALRGWTSR